MKSRIKKMKKSALLSLLMFTGFTHADITPLPELNEIKDYQQLNPKILTAGLPTETQFNTLSKAGVQLVINLMPNEQKDAHANEAKLVTDAGMEYVYIPVDWMNPKVETVEAFFEVMDKHRDKEIIIHCMANYRASAFAYLDQLRIGNKVSMEDTMVEWGDLQQSLQKYSQWAELIEQVKAKYNL